MLLVGPEDYEGARECIYKGLQGGHYLEGHGDLVSRLITLITHRITSSIPIVTLLTRSPDPPSRGYIKYVTEFPGPSSISILREGETLNPKP